MTMHQYQPTQYASPEKRTNGLAIAALIVGIVGFLTGVIPFITYGAWFLLVPALVLGVIALFLRDRKRGIAWAAVIVTVVGMVVAGVMAAASTAGLKAGADSIDKSFNGSHTVVMRATSKGKATVTWNTDDGTEQHDFTGKWSKKITVKGDFAAPSVDVTGDWENDSEKVTCYIRIDDQKPVKKSATGAASSATCDSSVDN